MTAPERHRRTNCLRVHDDGPTDESDIVRRPIPEKNGEPAFARYRHMPVTFIYGMR
jgi:hypothetical protein